jgi:two-component system sensor histidine kinase/response regulator
VLLIGQEPDALDALTKPLQSANATTTTTESAHSALRLIEQATRDRSPFDAVLIDWGDPGSVTIKHLQTLREQLPQKGHPEVPLLCLLPPYARQTLVEAGHDAQPDAVLIKPVLPGQIKRALSNVHPRAQAVVHASPAQALQQRGLPLKGRHILLVEDNMLNQMVAQAFLQQAGMDVTCAADGGVALDILNANAPDCFAAILMDMHMPVMDGLEATRRIRTMGNFQNIPVIAMTAAVLSNDKAQCLDAGMVDFVAKPIIAERLIDVLLKWVPQYCATVR